MKIQKAQIEALVALVQRRYPGWEGFSDARFIRAESEGIRRGAARFAKLLGFAPLRALLERREFDEVIRRIERIGHASPLIYKGTPDDGDLNILHHAKLERGDFCEAFVELIHGSSSSPERLERFLAWAASRGLPSKWTFATWYLMLAHPESDLFIKPIPMRWAHHLLAGGSDWTAQPSRRAYSASLHLAEQLRTALEQYAPHDMIDIFALLRAASREAASVRYWKISPGENAGQWKECRRGNFIGIGWELFGDISKMSKEEFQSRHAEILRNFPELKKEKAWSRTSVRQLWEFRSIRPGDRIVANRGTREILGTGVVTGGYYFLPGERNGHRLPVRWSRDGAGAIDDQGWRRPLEEIEPGVVAGLGLVGEVEEVEKVGEVGAGVAEESVGYDAGGESSRIHRPYPLEEVAANTGIETERLLEWVGAIERKGGAIIQGPPGTGKTFLATHLARHLTGGGDGLLSIVQFHPSYSYEEFILGIRPETTAGGSVRYPLVPGRFLEFCERARTRTGRSVIIIDEINRADLPRVFGELMYLLEYRDAEVTLSGGRRISIPPGVRIIGTMNTADRSIALVDSALRRRFAFLPLGPETAILRHYHARSGSGFDIEPLLGVIERLNREIENRHYQLGISYFLRNDLDRALGSIWRLEIEPYLEEFFYDRPELVERYRWERLGL